ncbi:MAG: hypothetical protein AB1714_01810 [Acidobacteriota bacterium]
MTVFLRRAAETAAAKVEQQADNSAVKYIERYEDLYIEKDYSLRVNKTIRLVCVKGPLCCLTTGWTSNDVPATIDEVGFEVSALPRSISAFGLLLKDQPERKEVVVGLLPPVKNKNAFSLEIVWTWPRWWTALRMHGRDRVVVEPLSAVKKLRVRLFCHKKVCIDGHPGVLAVNPDVGSTTSPTDAGSYIVHDWTYHNAPARRYELTFSF